MTKSHVSSLRSFLILTDSLLRSIFEFNTPKINSDNTHPNTLYKVLRYFECNIVSKEMTFI